jgi:hypothetical protein
MAVISHANRIRFVGPRNGNKDGSKDLLTRQSPPINMRSFLGAISSSRILLTAGIVISIASFVGRG